MQRATRILLCRLGLLLICVVPTIVVGTWIVMRGAGGAAALEAESERASTGRRQLAVELGAIAYPRPNVVRLEDVRLFDPQTRALLIDATTLEVSRTVSGWNITALEPRRVAEQPMEGQVPAAIRQPPLR